jgi:hypothetical protein
VKPFRRSARRRARLGTRVGALLEGLWVRGQWVRGLWVRGQWVRGQWVRGQLLSGPSIRGQAFANAGGSPVEIPVTDPVQTAS